METSYNGWPASPDKNAIGIAPFGDKHGLPFPGGVKAGDVAKVLGYVCTQLHYRVEPCVSGWDWGYTYRANVNNPSVLSCHSSGTAVDYNAPNHPNGVHGTWSTAQVGEVRKILAEVAGAVQWGEDYTGTVDGMHFEIIVDAGTLARVAASLPDPTTPPPTGDWFDMATEDDLNRIVAAQVAQALDRYLPRMIQTIMTGAANQTNPIGSAGTDGMGIHGYFERLPQFLRLGQANKAFGTDLVGADNVGIDGTIKKYAG